MNKSRLSTILASMLVTAGFAAAQTSAPATRAEVKSQATPMKAGNDGGEVPVPAVVPVPPSPPTSRAEVKSQATPMKAGVDGGEGPVRGAAAGSSGDVPPNTRAAVKAQINTTDIKSGNDAGSGATPADNPSTKNTGVSAATTAERKAKREERNAMAKAKREAKASAAGAEPMKDGKSQ